MCKGESQREKQQLQALEEQLQQKQEEYIQIKNQLKAYQREFATAQRKVNFFKKTIAFINNLARALVGYPLGRRNIKRLYSYAYKRKDAANQLKPYTYRLYELGFIEKTLKDLRQRLNETQNRYLKRAISWELALWYAHQRTKDDYIQSLFYLDLAKKGERVLEQKRKIAILQAEAYDFLQQPEKGQTILREALKREKHPDLYLAAANLEKNIDERIRWINHTLAFYQIGPIMYQKNAQTKRQITYEDLRTIPTDQVINKGPLVSVIIPAYNFASGIHIAIESILHQTWRNIEILIVDDCSTDDTVKVIKNYMEKDKRIKLFSTDKNSGAYVARNIGLKKAKGEFVTVNDADDWSHAEKIERQVKHLIKHPDVIANTSEHARITDDLKFHRRGTLGSYIFSNMSSLMFRRKPVLEKIGFWDSVRFAADGEFKRRLLKVFGEDKVVDLKTGPLSFPRQSIHSLTGSSAFGYQGFFMGARKEYVESFEHYYQKGESFYYPFPQEKRFFQVPMPMQVKQRKTNQKRHFDVVYALDFHTNQASFLKNVKIHKKFNLKTGIMPLSCYNRGIKKPSNQAVREAIDGKDVQMIVYGEEVSCELLIVNNISSLQEKQKYIPKINPKIVVVVIDQLPISSDGKRHYTFRECAKNVRNYFGRRGKWYALHTNIYQSLTKNMKRELRFIDFASECWEMKDDIDQQSYHRRLEEWLV